VRGLGARGELTSDVRAIEQRKDLGREHHDTFLSSIKRLVLVHLGAESDKSTIAAMRSVRYSFGLGFQKTSGPSTARLLQSADQHNIILHCPANHE
jgi:hypothetical protein